MPKATAMSIALMIDQYLGYVDTEKVHPQVTLAARRRDLGQFRDFLDHIGICEVSQLDKKHIVQFL